MINKLPNKRDNFFNLDLNLRKNKKNEKLFLVI